MDMTKISMRKQEEGESVSQSLTCMTEVHDANSGLEHPAAFAEVAGYSIESTS